MKNLIGSCMFAQSGGPTAVINASCAGVFTEALKQKNITSVYGVIHGIKGVLNEDFCDIGKEDVKEIELLKYTPAAALGSVRYKLNDFNICDNDYKKIFEVFKKYDVRYFFYNGGNDSMDTCQKIYEYSKKTGYEINVIGVPKTIDNDLTSTDHCPGYGSAAKFIATAVMEINRDAYIYDSPLVVIIEIMGRNAGWLTASAALSNISGCGADLIYLPEIPFDNGKFLYDVRSAADRNGGKCIVAVSEGIKYPDGSYVSDQKYLTDVFGHCQLGGVGNFLKRLIIENLGVKCKSVELNILQRCASHIASQTDIEESFEAGKQAVIAAVSGETGKMVIYKRKSNFPYDIDYALSDLSEVANKEKTIPLSWITCNGTNLSHEFTDYAFPLIQGETKQPKENGLPRFSKLKFLK